MPRRAAVALLWVAGIGSAEQPEALLEQVRERARKNLERLPDYVCAQTVERSLQRHPSGRLARLDVLRLEVAMVGDRELVAWAGASRFEEQDITELVERGTIGNGAFGLHARNILLSAAPEIGFAGEDGFDGVRAFRFQFEVPRERSTYRLRVPPRAAVVGYRGEFWVDAETLDLVRLRVVVEEIPEDLGVVFAGGEIRYGRVRVGDGEFLLPQSADLTMVSSTGEVARNQTRFENCRRYAAESSVSFAATGSTPEPASPEQGLRLPPRAPVELELQTEVDLRHAALGDEVRAIVARPVREGGRVVIPAGSVALGRLVRLERQNQPVDHYVVGLEFHTIEAGGEQIALRARMRRAGPAGGLLEQAKRLDPTFDPRRRRPFLQVLVNEQQRGQGILLWQASYPILNRGLKMRWEILP